ncbi:hypothetical protein JB92DRAFT_1784401 [Gautieria morchelliformis]|nr:hypothetical protein JB92DRAFT_1784401 [Gautieria morchelliformis]
MRGFRQRWEPNLPQFLGASESRPTGDDRFIVLEGPQGDGKVAKYISSLAARSPLEASRTLICMLKGLGSGAKHSLERTKGQWGLTDYDVYIGEHEQLVVYNFGLMLDPQWDGPRLRLQDWRHWDAFINLFTKTLTNDSKQANYIHGQIGASKQAVFRLVKHLVIFAWDYSNTIGDQIRKTSTAAVTMMLVAFMESLSRMEACLDEIDNEDRNPLLTVLVKIFGQKLSGIWDFDSPQNIATGDIGYMAGTITKPRFERLGNILNEIPSVTTVERLFLPIQYRPQDDFWSEDVVDGVVRHKCLVANMSAKETLFRVERGHRSGRLDESLMGGYMRWDCSRTWEYLLNNREDLCRRYADNHSLSDDDLLLIFSHKQSTGHGMILFVSNSLTSDERRAVLQSEGFDGDVLYFFENVNPRHGELWGYWSREAEPGHPIWPPSIDAEGPPWAWDARKDNYRVEVSRTSAAYTLPPVVNAILHDEQIVQ